MRASITILALLIALTGAPDVRASDSCEDACCQKDNVLPPATAPRPDEDCCEKPEPPSGQSPVQLPSSSLGPASSAEGGKTVPTQPVKGEVDLSE